MANYNPARYAEEYIFYIGLVDQANTKLFKANPTLAAGDFKVSIDGGALNNLAALPTVTPAAGKMVKIVLSAAEMTGDNITVVCSDAAGAEWCDQVINIQTDKAFKAVVIAQAVTGTLSTTQATTNLTEATNNHYNGKTITPLTGAAAGQSKGVTGYDGTSKMLTYGTMTDAMANGDWFMLS